MAQDELPAISALFVARFDQKVGYTIAWKRSVEGLDLDGVEYQCLPSGLHSVQEDLVYFTKGQYAGISAFVQGKADKQHRNADFAAVGLLLPQSAGRPGRSWLHAEVLRSLARDVVKAPQDRKRLEIFWEKYGRAHITSEAASPALPESSSPEGPKRDSAGLAATGASQVEDTASADHPALSMPALLATFGPLVFPLHRAALLRKRILLLGTTPVQQTCDFVYCLSILSTVPEAFQSMMHSSYDARGSNSLFNVGIFDIPRLQEHKHGYLACSTDDILSEKKDLYDIIVDLPAANDTPDVKLWPKLRTPEGQTIRATQRDYRRYVSLQRELQRLQSGHISGMQYRDDATITQDDEDVSPLIRHAASLRNGESTTLQTAVAEVVESESWSSLAYRSFMWWASATELEAWEAEELLTDQGLLEGMPPAYDFPRERGSSTDGGEPDAGRGSQGQLYPSTEARYVATVMFNYFERLTTLALQILISAKDDAKDSNDESEVVEITAEDARRMGIDTWNPNDRDFVEQAMKLYFGREAVVVDDGVQLCGVKIC